MNPATSNITTHTYKTVGDVKIELDVHIPPVSPPTDGYPVFFAIHEGGYVLGSKDKAFTDEERKEVMKRGWALVSINHRLLPSVFMPDMLEDVQDAYKWVRTELVKTTPINPNLITVFGQSAGGGFAVMSGYKFSPRPQAIISFYPGCTNWTDPGVYKSGTPVDPQFAADAKKFSTPVVTEYHRTGPNDTKMDFWNAVDASGKLGWLVTTHDPNLSDEEILKSLKSFSATENVDENYPPTYLGHGMADEDVPYSQSVQLADKLKELKIPHVLDLVPDAKHNFDSDPNLWQKHVLPAFDFAQKYMQKNST